MEKAGNRRTRMTKQLLKQSLLELLEQKKINAITVKEICERADVNRSTFYAYYSSPYDLFDSMKQDIIAESRALLVCELRLTPEQRMRFLLERHLRYLSEHLREFQAYSSDTGEDFSLPLQVMADMMGPYLDYLRGKYPRRRGGKRVAAHLLHLWRHRYHQALGQPSDDRLDRHRRPARPAPH